MQDIIICLKLIIIDPCEFHVDLNIVIEVLSRARHHVLFSYWKY